MESVVIVGFGPALTSLQQNIYGEKRRGELLVFEDQFLLEEFWALQCNEFQLYDQWRKVNFSTPEDADPLLVEYQKACLMEMLHLLPMSSDRSNVSVQETLYRSVYGEYPMVAYSKFLLQLSIVMDLRIQIAKFQEFNASDIKAKSA